MAVDSLRLVIEMRGCAYDRLNDREALLQLLHKAAKAADVHVLGEMSHQFDPQGVTAILLLSESHLSIHTWPEKGYASADFFTCGSNSKPWLALAIFKEVLQPRQTEVRELKHSIEA
ncbi:MAG: adenosylmethionine decarboxylase [Bacteroidetes bacterium]|jgi:S-adenosylmethionine decarboxylase|nr:MAG: adenosylmethionine decarboxylase [Bacteroidota bacterium]